jgi:RNA polymerase sigma-70 factor (ECF subfamily)
VTYLPAASATPPADRPPRVTAEYVDVAFDAFVQSNFASWVRLAHLYMGDRAEAELVACEVTLRLHETWEEVLGRVRNLPLHAFTLLRAEIEDRFAQRAGEQMVENAAFLRAMRAAREEFAVLAESIGVYSAISRLPERQFQVIALRYVLGYDVKRAAAMMGVSHQTISSLTYYAKRALADALGSAVRGTERGGREQDESELDQDTYKEVRA